MKSFTRRLLFGLPVPFLLSSREPNTLPTGTSAVWNRTELFFGTAQPNGPAVTDAQFSSFVDEDVTPRFPDQLTILDGYGQFKNSAGVIEKWKSFVLILFYPPQKTDANKLIEEIREKYKAMFQQESVLRADSNTLISF